jgi:hypothetical protein
MLRWLKAMNKAAMYLMYPMYLFCMCVGTSKKISCFLDRMPKMSKRRDFLAVIDPVFRFIGVHQVHSNEYTK